MPKEDAAQIAHRVFRQSIGEGAGEQEHGAKKDEGAVSLGRKGGEARAKRLSPEERKKISQDAARARWKKNQPDLTP